MVVFFGLVCDSDDKLLVVLHSLTLAPMFSLLRTPSAPKGSDSDDVVFKLIFALGLQKAVSGAYATGSTRELRRLHNQNNPRKFLASCL